MTTPPPARRAPVWQILTGVALSAVLLYFSLRNVQFKEVVEYIRTAHKAPILLGVVLATIPFVLRIFRWQLLLRGDAGEKLPMGPLWHAIAMGFMANNVLPLRVGEVVRSYAGARLTNTRFTSVLASIAVERLFDAIAVTSLLALGLFATKLPRSAVAGFGVGKIVTIAGIAVIMGLLLAGVVLLFPLGAERVIRRIVPSDRLAGKLIGMIEGVRHGLSVLRSPGRVAGVLAWSFVGWLVSALSYWVMLGAFGISIDFFGGLLLQGLIMFGIALPSTPGYAGVFELPIIAVLALYDVPQSLAFAYAVTYHVTTFLPITLLGAWSVFRTNLKLTAFQKDPG